MKKLNTLFLSIFFITLSLGVSSQNITLKIGIDPTFPPMEYQDDDLNLVGFDIDLMNAIAQEGNFKVKFIETGFDGMFSQLDMGRVDAVISGITILDERKKTMDFSLPYLRADEVVFIGSSSPDIHDFNDLEGRTVATQSGAEVCISALSKLVEKYNVKTKFYDSLDDGIADLGKGAIQGFVYDSTIFWSPDYKGKINILGTPLIEGFYGIAVKKNNTKILNMINENLQKVIDSGKMKEIKDKWLK
jgi:polar amino acid transport system substrate-binding protein